MDAIRQRVDSFVREILTIAGRAREERRADALAVVTRMLAGLGNDAGGEPATTAGSRKPRAPAQRKAERPKASTARPAPALAAAAPRRRGRPPKAASAVASAPKPAAVELPPAPATLPTGVASVGARREASDREALVLDAVRSLGRATATEVAGRCGQPNGSVFVALRALVAHGRVARAKTPKGIEYSIPG